MEIKKFKAEGILYALSFVKMVYNHSIRNTNVDPSCNVFFDEYMNEEAITAQVNAGELIVWGAIWNNEVLGVSAMTRDGHITMLYVNPNFHNKGIGRCLLETMKKEACSSLNLKWITVNATPAFTASYFMRNGFKATDYSQDYNSPFISLAAKCNRIREYSVRKFSWVKTLVTVAIFICLILGSSFGYIFYYLTTH